MRPFFVRNCGNGEGESGALLPYRTKVKWRITQKDLQLFRASPHAPEWSGNIHESKLSDIHRPTQSRLPIGRLKSYKYKKSAYGGKKKPGSRREKRDYPIDVMPCMIIRITRVAASPIPAFPKGKEHHATTSNTARRSSRLLGRDGDGLSGGPSISSCFCTGESRSF